MCHRHSRFGRGQHKVESARNILPTTANKVRNEYSSNNVYVFSFFISYNLNRRQSWYISLQFQWHIIRPLNNIEALFVLMTFVHAYNSVVFLIKQQTLINFLADQTVDYLCFEADNCNWILIIGPRKWSYMLSGGGNGNPRIRYILGLN